MSTVKPGPVTISRWINGPQGSHAFEMTITPSDRGSTFAGYTCTIDGVEVPGDIFDMALRLATAGAK